VNHSIYNATYAVAVPGSSLLLAQAATEDRVQVLDMGRTLLQKGTAPDAVIKAITDPALDGAFFAVFPYYTVRQYGVVDVKGRTAGYTGPLLDLLYATAVSLPKTDQSHRHGTTGSYAYSAQGNVVTKRTVQTLQSTFVGSSGCDLADRLMEAVDAVSTAGEGDARCIVDGFTAGVHAPIPGTGAYLHVENPDGTDLVHIDVVGDGTFNPVKRLREEYDAWRAKHPCPLPKWPSGAPVFPPTWDHGAEVYPPWWPSSASTVVARFALLICCTIAVICGLEFC
jgi:uncharacterized Ntn-hydrolase superfamily protein